MKYIRFPPLHEIRRPQLLAFWGCHLFRNNPGVVAGRWGFCFFGFDIGSRNPQDPIGVFLKRIGLWPW